MKRYGNLIEKIADPDNLKNSIKEVIRGSMKKSYRSSKVILKDPMSFINSVIPQLLDGSWKPKKYTEFSAIEGRKVRTIQSLPIPDRIILHAIMNVIGKGLINKILIRDTYSSIKGRGMLDGTKRIRTVMKRDPKGTMYCVKTDFTKFYNNIDKPTLINQLRLLIKDKVALQLLVNVIESYPKGLPIGFHSSQFLGNYYLDLLDRYVKQFLKVKYYFRYCDDIVVLGPSKRYVWRIFNKMREFCIKNLKIDFKSNYRVFPVNEVGVDFLGYVDRHETSRIRKCIISKVLKKLTHLESLNRINEIISSFNGWLLNCDEDPNKINLVKLLKSRRFDDLPRSSNSLGLINKILGMSSIRKFSELGISQEYKKVFRCSSKCIDDIINLPIIILDAETNIDTGKYESNKVNKCVFKFRFVNDESNTEYKVITAAKLIVRAITKMKEMNSFNIEATVRKSKEADSFSSHYKFE